MLRFVFLFAMAGLAGPILVHGQADEAAVTSVVNQLFYAMQKGDSAMVSPLFTRDATLATVMREKSGKVVVNREDASVILKAVGTPHKGTWYEEIWNLKIQIDGDLATAWCDYAFYVDNTFSHCGVDAFHLVRTAAGWKIFHLADTRRKEGCVIPGMIEGRHKSAK